MGIAKDDRSYLLLEEKRIYRAFIYLALPVMIANVFVSLHDLVDTYFIGNMENSVPAQAGISITWPLLNIFLALSSGMAVAGVSIISQYLGANNIKRAKEYISLLMVLSVAIGSLFCVMLYACSPYVLNWMGAEDAVYQEALTYLRVRAFEMPFLFLFSAFQSTRQARGDTTTPVVLTIISIIINIVLTALFIHVYHMGVLGAALSTVIGRILIIPSAMYMIFRKKDPYHITLYDLTHIVPSHMKKLFLIATPSAGSQAFSSLGFLILQKLILGYGEKVAAAFSIGNKISNLLLIPVTALGSVLAAFVGQNIGAGNRERAKKSYHVSRNVALLIACVGCIILFPFRRFFINLLTNDIETANIAMEYIFWVILTQPLMSLFQNYMGVFNGSGNTKYSFAIATARLWLLRLPMILIMKNFTDFGRMGIWYAMVLSNLIILVLARILFRKVNFESKV